MRYGKLEEDPTGNAHIQKCKDQIHLGSKTEVHKNIKNHKGESTLFVSPPPLQKRVDGLWNTGFPRCKLVKGVRSPSLENSSTRKQPSEMLTHGRVTIYNRVATPGLPLLGKSSPPSPSHIIHRGFLRVSKHEPYPLGKWGKPGS